MRALGLVAVAALLALAPGCGDDTTSASSGDLAVLVLDLSTPSNGGQVCGATTCAGSCTVCVPIAGGVCGIPCNSAAPATCTSGICNPVSTDGGASATFAGACAAYDGFCG
jgi:hypothetical protein